MTNHLPHAAPPQRPTGLIRQNSEGSPSSRTDSASDNAINDTAHNLAGVLFSSIPPASPAISRQSSNESIHNGASDETSTNSRQSENALSFLTVGNEGSVSSEQSKQSDELHGLPIDVDASAVDDGTFATIDTAVSTVKVKNGSPTPNESPNESTIDSSNPPDARLNSDSNRQGGHASVHSNRSGNSPAAHSYHSSTEAGSNQSVSSASVKSSNTEQLKTPNRLQQFFSAIKKTLTSLAQKFWGQLRSLFHRNNTPTTLADQSSQGGNSVAARSTGGSNHGNRVPSEVSFESASSSHKSTGLISNEKLLAASKAARHGATEFGEDQNSRFNRFNGQENQSTTSSQSDDARTADEYGTFDLDDFSVLSENGLDKGFIGNLGDSTFGDISKTEISKTLTGYQTELNDLKESLTNLTPEDKTSGAYQQSLLVADDIKRAQTDLNELTTQLNALTPYLGNQNSTIEQFETEAQTVLKTDLTSYNSLIRGIEKNLGKLSASLPSSDAQQPETRKPVPPAGNNAKTETTALRKQPYQVVDVDEYIPDLSTVNEEQSQEEAESKSEISANSATVSPNGSALRGEALKKQIIKDIGGEENLKFTEADRNQKIEL